MIKNDKADTVCSMDTENLVNGRRERRQHKRIVVENIGLNCDMPSASRVKVINVSGGGALVMADRVINIGKEYALKIGFKNKTVFVKAIAVWALLADSVKEVNGEIIPLYIAGMKFVDVIKGEISEIVRLIEAHVDGNMYDAFIGNLQGNAHDAIS